MKHIMDIRKKDYNEIWSATWPIFQEFDKD